MHWRSLLLGSELYRARSKESGDWDRFYREYMASRDASQWQSPDELTKEEVRKLIRFINQLGTRSQFDPEKLRCAYAEVFPVLQAVKGVRLHELSAPQPLGRHGTLSRGLETVFDTVAKCSVKYESTGTSKILHTWLPDLCVMWDAAIAAGYGVYNRRDGKAYAAKFLPRVSYQASEALQTYIADTGGTHAEAAAAISRLAGYKPLRPLTKLVDEYNYAKYTISADELWST